MSRGPVASQLVLLSNLPLRPIGEKVRFLGWYDSKITLQTAALVLRIPSLDVRFLMRLLTRCSVTSYSTESGCLSLGHIYPKNTNVMAVVDITLLLETLTSELTRVGEYVNVIGYITAKRRPQKTPQKTDATGAGTQEQETMRVSVQALVVWATGPMDIQRYETAFQDATSSR